MKKPVVAMLGFCVLALAACGGGEGEGTISPSQPQPKKPIAELVDPFNEALAGGGCKAAAEMVFSVLREKDKPGAPPTKAECAYLKTPNSFLRVLADVEFTDSEEFGTAALMAADVPGDEKLGPHASALWVLDRDGEYRYVAVTHGDAQLGESLPEGNDADEVAAKIVSSVREGKCDTDLVNPEGSLALGDPKAACEAIEEGNYFAPAVKADAKAKPERMGETLDWAFYGVDTKDGFFTLILHSLPSEGKGQSTEYGLYDVLRSS